MTREEIRATVLRVLGDIAPEADLAALDPRVELRQQLDLDSMDVLNFVVGLHEALQVDIPEADYPRYATLHGCLEQLASRASASLPSTSRAARAIASGEGPGTERTP